ncbi:MAG: glycosyltransferase family 4 protein [Chthoniobacterales bacterium]
MERVTPPLRILVVVSFPWDARLGAPQVWMELAAQWRASGHHVEKYSLSDAFPDGAGAGSKFLINQLRFAYRAAAFVKQNGHRFDVIDAFIGALPFSKARLGFDGLMVARSVGLHRWYDAFERDVARRWPRRRTGRVIGRIFYSLTRRQLLRASETSLRRADLINVPNVEEAEFLRQEIRPPERVFVQPYGLTAVRRRTLHDAAAPAEVRLAQRRVCFVGMWSARKGAYDWGRIIALVRAQLPDTRFTFIGTMVESATIAAELGPASAGIDFISSYDPAELPGLLAAHTVGAFPSYVEGFGLAVLEQLAARIPMVAYDAAGPRDILGHELREGLVPVGDVEAFAESLIRILRMDGNSYQELAERSSACAARFSWSAIAGATVKQYRQSLSSPACPSIMFVQPFTLTTAGGGARILRALLAGSPVPCTIVCTSPERPDASADADQLHIPFRPFFGRIERTRLAPLPEKVAPLSRPFFRKRLRAACRQRRAIGIHAIPHAGLDFYDSYTVAKELGLPFFLQVHDDLLYSAKGRLNLRRAGEALQEAWTGADARFVISRQLGDEYCRRYGDQEFVTITDGVESIAEAPVASNTSELRLYFMGLFHIGYEENLRVLLSALARLRELRPQLPISLTMRCGQLRPHLLDGAEGVRVLPFGSEADVRNDLASADLLYLPLPFGAQFERFTKLSLSTKLVTYVGSGIPILYHGPGDAAVCELLRENDAAFLQTELAVESMLSNLAKFADQPDRRRDVAQHALQLAHANFMLADQQRKFWNAIMPFYGGTAVADSR